MSTGLVTRGMICKGGGSRTIIAWDHDVTILDASIEAEIDNSNLDIELVPLIEVVIEDLVSMEFVVNKGVIITGGMGAEGFGTSDFGDTESEERDIYSKDLDIKVNQ